MSALDLRLPLLDEGCLLGRPGLFHRVPVHGSLDLVRQRVTPERALTDVIAALGAGGLQRGIDAEAVSQQSIVRLVNGVFSISGRTREHAARLSGDEMAIGTRLPGSTAVPKPTTRHAASGP